MAQSSSLTVEVRGSHSKTYEEGMIAGLIAAAAIAVWFLLLDVFQGRPFYTPNVLGTALFRGREGLASLENLPISFQVVLTFTWVHGLAFVVFGVAAAWLVHLAERDPNYGFGILLLLVVIGFGLISVNLVLAEAILRHLALPAILVGNLLAAAAMAGYFRHRHPDLTFHP